MDATIDFNDQVTFFTIKIGDKETLNTVQFKFYGVLTVESISCKFSISYHLPELFLGRSRICPQRSDGVCDEFGHWFSLTP